MFSMEFLQWPWIASFAMITITLTLFFYSPSKHATKKLPPEAAGGWPLIGHLFQLAGPEPLHMTLSKMADKYGPVFSIRRGPLRGVVINSWETAKECYKTNDLALSNRSRTNAIDVMGYDYAIFAFDNYGAYWREIRKIVVLRLLSNRKVAALGGERELHVSEMMRRVNGQAKMGISVDMTKVFGDLTLNMMIRMVVGDVEMKMGLEEREKWHKRIRDYFKMLSYLTVSDVLPYLWWVDTLLGRMNKPRKIGSELDKVMQQWLEKKKSVHGGDDEGKDDDDFMTVMLSVVDDVAKEFRCHDADTINKATCLGMIVAGTDTTTITLTRALALLLNNRHTLEKAQEELDLHVGQERHVKESDIDKLVYIQAIIKETMRLLPATTVNHREAREDCVVAGYHVAKGTHIYINTWKIQKDPRVWIDPIEFKPERFLTTHKEIDVHGLHFEYVPFGGGRRVCPGIAFALRNMQLALASFLHGFDIDTPSRGAVEMNSVGNDTPLEVCIKPRLSHQVYA